MPSYRREEGNRTVFHLFQFKYVESFEKADHNFPSNEIDKLLGFMADLLRRDSAMRQTCNELLWAKVLEIWAAFDEGTPLFVVHFAGNLKAMVEHEQLRLKQSSCRSKSPTSVTTPWRRFLVP